MKFKTAILRLTLVAGTGLLALGYGLFLKSPKPASPPAPCTPVAEPALGEKIVRLAQLSPEPDAGEIVQAVDPRNVFVNYEFDGSMTKVGTVVPFKLRFKDGRQFYSFQEPWRKIQVTGRGANSVLEEFPLGSGSAIKVAAGHRPGSLRKGYDFQGQRIKVLAVTSGMKVDGAIMIKSMDVIRYDPGTKKETGKTTFTLKKP